MEPASNYLKFKPQKGLGQLALYGFFEESDCMVSRRLTFLSAHFDRHGLLSARGVAGTDRDQVRGVRLEVPQERGVLSPGHGDGVKLAPGQGGVLHVVTRDPLWLRGTPTHPDAGLPRLRDRHHGGAQHIWWKKPGVSMR